MYKNVKDTVYIKVQNINFNNQNVPNTNFNDQNVELMKKKSSEYLF